MLNEIHVNHPHMTYIVLVGR